jgi:hypothetical protein
VVRVPGYRSRGPGETACNLFDYVLALVHKPTETGKAELRFEQGNNVGATKGGLNVVADNSRIHAPSPIIS